MSINASVFKTIEELESKLAELRKIVGMAEIEAPKKGAAKKAKKVKSDAASEGADEAPKEKRPPNAFMVFQGRLRELLKENGYSVAPKDGFPQFAGFLNDKTAKNEVEVDGKKRKVADFDSWTDEAILAERASWTKPEVSKQALAGKNKKDSSSAGSAEKEEPVADEAAAPAEKPKKVLSEEQKAKMAAGRAAAKAKKEAEKAAAAAPAEEPKKEEAAAAAPAAPAKKPGKQMTVKKPAPKKELDLRFRPWVFEGTNYWRNERGDVMDEALAWVGRYSEEKGDIDSDVEAPEDLGDVECLDE